jgi:leucyl aminopeptidase
MPKSTAPSADPILKVAGSLPSTLDALAVGIPEKTTAVPKALAWLDDLTQGVLSRVLALGDFKAKTGSSYSVPATKSIQRLILLGLGKPSQKKPITLDALRWAAANLLKSARANKLSAVALALPSDLSPEETGQAIAEGALLGSFQYNEFKPGKPEEKAPAIALSILQPDASQQKTFQMGITRGTIIGRATNLTRNLACKPGNIINPVTLVAAARSIAAANGLKIKVIAAAEAKRLGMGGLVGVGQGSPTPPALILLEWHGRPASAKKSPPIAIVGKAITFDTGGISIKPAADMDAMKYDKCGGMAVLGIMQAAAQLKLPLHLIGVIPTAENAVGSAAYRPGDILRLYNGKTVEVTNTDAEGRLILADAVAYTADKFKPEIMIDMATLTGGVVVALGSIFAGLFSTDDALAAALHAAGQTSSDWVWRLPLHERYKKMMDGHHADLINAASREASPITGASFIQQFVPDSVKWAHIDIAGTAFPKHEDRYLVKGATGFGVRLILEYLRSQQ